MLDPSAEFFLCHSFWQIGLHEALLCSGDLMESSESGAIQLTAASQHFCESPKKQLFCKENFAKSKEVYGPNLVLLTEAKEGIG